MREIPPGALTLAGASENIWFSKIKHPTPNFSWEQGFIFGAEELLQQWAFLPGDWSVGSLWAAALSVRFPGDTGTRGGTGLTHAAGWGTLVLPTLRSPFGLIMAADYAPLGHLIFCPGPHEALPILAHGVTGTPVRFCSQN